VSGYWPKSVQDFLEAQNEKLRTSIRELEAENAQRKQDFEGACQELNQVKAKLKWMTEKESDTAMSWHKCWERVSELEDELEVINANSIADIATMNVRKSKIEALEAERDRLSKSLTDVQDERASSFSMLQKAVGEPYGLTPYQPEVDLEIAANIQRLRSRHAALVEVLKKAYSKHQLDDPNISWSELGEMLHDALCNSLGDDGFIKWFDEYKATLAGVKK
jgi:chromosome segregation ATPase